MAALAAVGALAALALPAAAAADTSLSISDSGCKPAVVTVKQGEVVTWTNAGKRDHTVTSDTGMTMK
jgi:plastocyanin